MNSPRKDSDLLLSHKLIDARRLLYFYYVARTGRFTGAEAALNVAQSAISRQLQQLEMDLGVQLFDRTGRGVRLTSAGQLLFDHSEEILSSMATTVDALQEASKAPQVNVSIAAPPSFMSACMGDVVADFTSKFPEGRIRVIEASTGGVFNSLVNGEVDLAIVLEPAGRARFDVQKLVSQELYLIAAPGHPLVSSDVVTRASLRQHAMILPASLHGSRAILKRFLDGAEMPLRSNVEVDSLPLMKELLASKPLCTILPAVACWDELKQGKLTARPLKPGLQRTLYVARLKEKPISEAMKFLIRCVTRVIRERSASFDVKSLRS